MSTALWSATIELMTGTMTAFGGFALPFTMTAAARLLLTEKLHAVIELGGSEPAGHVDAEVCLEARPKSHK
jgi:hypothetical protein